MKQLKLPSLIVAISVVITFGFSNRALSQSESRLCRNISQLKDTAGQLEKINGNSSLGELKEIQQDILTTLGLFREEIGSIEIDEMKKRTRNIDRVVRDMEDDSTLNDIVGKIISEVIGIDSVTETIGSLSECDI